METAWLFPLRTSLAVLLSTALMHQCVDNNGIEIEAMEDRKGMLKRSATLVILVMVLSVMWIGPAGAQTDGVVRAVFFYSPTCPHCHLVMEEVLPVLEAEYGDKLVIAQLNTAEPAGNALWQAAVTIFKPEVVGVPMLVIGDKLLIGSRQIPELLPQYIEQYLALGGVGWPALPGVENAVATVTDANAESATVLEKFTRDLAGNILSVIVLIGLAVSLILVLRPRSWHADLDRRFNPWATYIVLAVGFIAAMYLAYVETTQTEAVCGPIGDCNTVQQSEFALIFGFLPVAVLGVIGYVGILATLVYRNLVRAPYARYAPAAGFAMILFGLLFSLYLTFLEPFVIGATCAWCLTSAVSMALLAHLQADAGWRSVKLFMKEIKHK